MTDVLNLARTNIKNLSPYMHGGNVWGISKKFQVPLDKIMDFSVSTNPLGPPPKVLKAIRKSLWLIGNYPDPDPKELKNLLAGQIGNVKTENITLGNGSVELIYLFAEAFLDAGHEAIISVPTFGEYEISTIRAGGKPKFVESHLFSDHPLSVKDLERVVSKKTRLIFLCNPNSPTGVMLPRDEIIEIIQFAEKRDILIFLDENYVDFVDTEKMYSLADNVTEFSNLFVLKSLTKFFSLVGLRIGFGVASRDIVNILNSVKMPWNVNNLAMIAAKEAVTDRAFIEKSRLFVSREKAYMLRQLQRIRWLEVHPSDANFFLMKITKDGLTSTQLKDRLIMSGLLIRDCANFRGLNDKFFRVSVRRHTSNKLLIRSLKQFTM